MVFWIYCQKGCCPYVCMHVTPASPIMVLFHTLFLVSHPGLGYGRGRHYISKVCGGIYDSLLSEQRSICRTRNFNFNVPFLALGNGRMIAWLLGASHLSMRVWESLVKSQVRTKTPHLVYSFSCRNADHMVRSALSRSMCSFPASKTKSDSSFSKCVSH